MGERICDFAQVFLFPSKSYDAVPDIWRLALELLAHYDSFCTRFTLCCYHAMIWQSYAMFNMATR